MPLESDVTTTDAPSLTWDLDSLLPHPESDDFASRLASFEKDLTNLGERSESLPEPSADADCVSSWTSFLDDYEDVRMRASDYRSFVGCHASADAENKAIQQVEGRLVAMGPLLARIETNATFALAGVDDASFEAFVAAGETLTTLRFFLEECRRNAKQMLPKEQQMLAAELGVDGIHGWGRLYDRISSELRVSVMERGKLVEKSPGQVGFDSPERSVRENNFFAANRAWSTIGDTCADAINHISGTRLTVYRRLGLQDHLDVPLRYNRMRRETLDAMWGAVAERRKMLLPYLEAKAKRLGIERLAWYDLNALPGAGAPKIEYADACATVTRSFGAFSKELGDFAAHAIGNRWIEAEDRPGKRQGGFCTGFPTAKQTRIFMTFTGSPDAMSTLAHELGHAYHSWVLRDRPLVLRAYPMNLAETASTFAESVVAQERLRQAQSDNERRDILEVALSDAVAMLMNIHARFVFEDRFHVERLRGEVSAARLTELMLDAQKDCFLGALDDEGWNPEFWISKLHFYISSVPFYNFPYTFGYLLSLGLLDIAKDFGDEFPERYREFLIATACELSEDSVQKCFGYDLSGPEFWNRGLDVIERNVARYCEIA